MPKSNRIRVVHLLSRLEMGGMENGVVNLCNGLNRDKFEPIICCLKGLGPMSQRVKPDVKLISFDFTEGKHPLRVFKLAAYFTKLKPDIVHTHGWGAGLFDGFIAGRLARVPKIINGEHGCFFETPMQIMLQKMLLKRFDVLLSVSEVLRKRVIAKYALSPESIRVIKNGVDTEKFHKRNDRKALLQMLQQEGYRVDTDKYILGCVGSLTPKKNQIMLLKAINNINEVDRSNIVVLMVGEGPNRDMLQKACVDYRIKDQIIFLGQRHDVDALYSVFDVLVQCSVTEGMSNVLLEAMASAVPVVCTIGCDEEREIMKEGINGVLVNDNDFEALSKAILILKNESLRSEYGSNAHDIIIDKFSINNMVNEYSTLYGQNTL